jgi:tetratricopeptide (TPR) repeat protein
VSDFSRLESLFDGWSASFGSTPRGVTVTVPRMSEGAMRVVKSDLESRFPEVREVAVSPTEQGGYAFDLCLTANGDDAIRKLFLAVNSLDLTELSPLLEELRAESDVPGRASAAAELALALEERKEFDLARRAYLLSLGLDPSLVKVRFNLATMLLKLGDIEAAVEHYETILEQDASFEPALHNLAAYHAQRGDRTSAETFLFRLLQAHPGSASAQLLAGQLAQQDGRVAQALEHYLRAIRIAPDGAEAHYRAAVILRELEMEKEALEFWNRYVTLSGTIPEGRQLSARIIVQGDPEGAAVIVDGVPVGNAPKVLTDLTEGRHQLGICSMLTELSCDLDVRKAKTYLVRYDLRASRLTYEPTAPKIRVLDESGQEVYGFELGRRLLERLHQPPEESGEPS